VLQAIDASGLSASIPPTLHPITGGGCITVCRSENDRDRTRRAATRLAAPTQGVAMTRCSIMLTAMAGIAAPCRSRLQTCAGLGLERVRKYMQPAGAFFVTMVLAVPSEPLATSLAQAGYLPRGVPLFKRILAVPGQSVCPPSWSSASIVELGTARERDRHGRPLPVWRGWRMIAD
jgi:type IV secretory pathway protease TraF